MMAGKAVLAVLLLVLGSLAVAEDKPAFAVFDGTRESVLNFPAHTLLELDDLATIEFWVRPGWKTAPDADPVVMSAMGMQGARYGVFLTADGRGVGLYAGDDYDYTAFDFTDGFYHHVAFVMLGDLTDVYIDGVFEDSLAIGIRSDLPITTLHIGSANGSEALFQGELGDIRIWNTALDPDDIATFRKVPLYLPGAANHPEDYALVGYSNFSADQRTFVLPGNDSTFEELLEDVAYRIADSQGAVDEAPVADALEAELAALTPDPDADSVELTPEEEALFDVDLDLEPEAAP
ncbi:MAG: LamG domain-containing protein [Pseudomonadales bacterium]|nr:LamG domain-containing protein [Pseudomonadales bacterium]